MPAADPVSSRPMTPLLPGGPQHGCAVVRWMGSLAALVLVPKCLLCVAGYLGFATGLGLAGVELCGGTADGQGLSLRSVVPVLGLLGLGVFSVVLGRRFFRKRSCAFVRNEVGRSFNQ